MADGIALRRALVRTLHDLTGPQAIDGRLRAMRISQVETDERLAS